MVLCGFIYLMIFAAVAAGGEATCEAEVMSPD